MTDTNLTVTVDAETEDAVDAIDDVTDAVKRLNAALEELEESQIEVEVSGSKLGETLADCNSSSNITY